MTIDKARDMLKTQIILGSGYNRNSAKLILAEVQREHGMAAADKLIAELELGKHFGFVPGEKLHY